MVEAKKNERANAQKEVKRLCKEFGYTVGMLRGALAEGRKNGEFLRNRTPIQSKIWVLFYIRLCSSGSVFLLLNQCHLGTCVYSDSIDITGYNTDKERCTSISKQAMDAFWAPTWIGRKSNRTWDYLLWAFYTHSNTDASHWTR